MNSYELGLGEFNERSKEYKAYLVARGHNPASILKEFDRTANLARTQARVPQLSECLKFEAVWGVLN